MRIGGLRGASGLRWRYGVAVAALLLVLLTELLLSTRQMSKTIDESAHLYAGYEHWRAHDFGVNPEHPPLVKMVAAAPLLGMQLKQPHPPNPMFFAEEYIGGAQLLGMNAGEDLLGRGRLAVTVFPLGLALLVFAAGWEMFGAAAGLLGLLLFTLEPTLLANGSLITTDMGVTAGVFATVYAFYRYRRAPGAGRLVVFALCFGLALVTKMSGAIVLPIVVLCAAAELVLDRGAKNEWKTAGAIVFAAVTGYVMLWGIYGFHYAARPAGLMIVPPLTPFAMLLPPSIHGPVLFFARWHLLPEAYLYGWTKLPIDQSGHPAFLFGRVYPTGVWYYFPAALVIKSSLTLLLLLAMTPLAYVRGLRGYRRELVFVLVPMAVILGASMTSHLNIGVRHVLPVYPFAVVLAGATAWVLARMSRGAKVAVAALLLLDAVSSLHAFPNYLPYANEAFGGSGKTYRMLSDSNVDWGQGLKQVSATLGQHPGEDCWFAFSQANPAPVGYGVGCRLLPSGLGMWAGQSQEVVPTRISGLVLVSATEASGATWGDGDLNPYRQFQDGRPEAVIANSVLLYRGTYEIPLLAAQSHYSQVPMLLRTGKGSEALAEAEKAVELAPDAPQVQAELGGTLLSLHRDAEAEEIFGKAMALAKAHRPDESGDVAVVIAKLRHPIY